MSGTVKHEFLCIQIGILCMNVLPITKVLPEGIQIICCLFYQSFRVSRSSAGGVTGLRVTRARGRSVPGTVVRRREPGESDGTAREPPPGTVTTSGQRGCNQPTACNCYMLPALQTGLSGGAVERFKGHPAGQRS